MVTPLISAGALHQVADRVSLLDVRWTLDGPDPDGYEAGHLPGAVFVDVDTDLAAPPGAGGRHPLPDADAFGAAMRRVGVSGGRAVVVYDASAGRAAARAWWLLRYHGHLDVRVLDGGLAAWVAEGGAVETGPVEPAAPGDFEAVPGAMPVVAADEVSDVAVLIDARVPERFRGEDEPIDPVAGRIPGAVNVPTTWNLDNHGHFKGRADLLDVYGAVGVGPAAAVAAYCGSGVTAAHTVLALELAGIRAALYPGSWSEWIADPERPVERG